MADEVTADGVAGVAALAAVHVGAQELPELARQLAGFLSAVRALPCPPEVEPMPGFTPLEKQR